MSVTSANVHNLNESRAQALQALQSVSERLGDILGDTDLSGDGTRRNEAGELVNEEGLPIIDITEPVDDLDTPSLSAATEDFDVIEDDNYPEPISKLSPEALAVSRKHRNKILDLLEQEEELEERKSRNEHQLEMKRKKEAARIEMEKRMLNQGLELENRRQAKELEKKMAKALISGLGEPEALNSKASTPHPDGKTKKVVTFADPPSVGSTALPKPEQENEISWGDVVPARLPAWKKRVASSQMQPMKMEVVERTSLPSSNSVSTPEPPEKLEDTEAAKDSDDESDLEHSSDTTVLESENEDVVLSAQRHRELALDYHRRREALISSAGTLKLEDVDLLDDEHNATSWDKEEVPLDATLAHSQPKPRISKFKASLFDRKESQTPTPATQTTELLSSPRGSAGPLRSATFGTSVLPSDSLSKSIKLGRLVDGQLVVGPQDEDAIDGEEREEEEIRKLLLKSMEEYSGIAAQVMGPATKGSYWANSAADETASSLRTPPLASTSRSKPKASRFKVNRTRSRPSSGPSVPASPHSHETSASALTYSRGEATSPLHQSIKSVSGSERTSPNLTTLHQNHMNTATASPIASSTTIVDSPSFAPLSGSRLASSVPNQPLPSTLSTPQSMAIDSPSFIPPPSPNIIESPSFRRPVGPSSSSSSARGPPTIIPTPPRHPSERQAVMIENVREKSANRDSPVSSTTSDVKPRRVSRFKADRSGD